ncbi:hypothetical protein HJ202_19295 [Vibrio parahaemolyticus]|uniref:hypothetical protein n=1 Tax=Vibrio parahaemolyticus TaxID=670 RepID=UPI000A372AE8|nr:hypothetical protein [Vibrio parahaemolyticus]HCZ9285113.1 hypothetical protein [Vibrio alginolyticus]MBE3722474.1 hypothetical protein [Vibrio parahaemolyticus]OUJ50922.1 hypothetical protein BTM22_11640 [Vibrio parahaemolyticus]TOP09665.1 hypothetical protein CGH26_17815 [Vibrio parahaemolyticus]HCE3682773.1 hypothetical protein [Vibrio parahaemolyticus]
MVAAIALLPLLGVIAAIFWGLNMYYTLVPNWLIPVVCVVVVASIFQIKVTYKELNESEIDNFIGRFLFSIHRTVRQYMRAAFMPVVPDFSFVKQTLNIMTKRKDDE